MAVSSASELHRADVAPWLAELELRSLPDLVGLRQQFKRLIKRYHPDANPGRAEWATRKSRRLIHAARVLESHLRSSESVAPESSPATRAAPEDRIAFQTIQDGRFGYAFPVAAIVRVVAAGAASASLEGPLPFVSDSSGVYPLLDSAKIEGSGEPGYFLLAQSGARRFALPLRRAVRFETILQVERSQVLRDNPPPRREGIWLRHGSEWRLCPVDFLDAIELNAA